MARRSESNGIESWRTDVDQVGPRTRQPAKWIPIHPPVPVPVPRTEVRYREILRRKANLAVLGAACSCLLNHDVDGSAAQAEFGARRGI